jgi:hypothetical protein
MGFREMRVPFGSRIFLQNFPFAEKHKDEILFVCLGLIHLSFHKERERPLSWTSGQPFSTHRKAEDFLRLLRSREMQEVGLAGAPALLTQWVEANHRRWFAWFKFRMRQIKE